jgi:hypothetical protein
MQLKFYQLREMGQTPTVKGRGMMIYLPKTKRSSPPAGFHTACTVGGGDGRFIPGMNYTWGDIPHQLKFFWNFFSGFENLVTLSVILFLRHLEAELSILRYIKVKLIGELFPLKQIIIFNFF